MAILRDNRGRVERRGRTQDGADIVRIGHLIEHHDRPVRLAQRDLVEEHVLQGRAFEHQPLMRRILGDQPRQIGDIGIFDREALGQFAIEAGDAFASRPQLAVLALGVLERRLDRVTAPQAHLSGAGLARPAPALHPPRASPQGALAFILGHPCSFVAISSAPPASRAIDRQAVLRQRVASRRRGPCGLAHFQGR